MSEENNSKEVIMSAGETETGFDIFIQQEYIEGKDVLRFDGEKWIAKKKRFEDCPVAFTISHKDVKQFIKCLTLENEYARKDSYLTRKVK